MAKTTKMKGAPQYAKNRVRQACGKGMVVDASLIGIVINHVNTYLDIHEQIHSLKDVERRALMKSLLSLEKAEEYLKAVGKRASRD